MSCEECNKTLQTETSLNKQRITTHGETHQRQTDAVFADNSKEDTVKGFMKKSTHKKQNQVSNPSICSHSITTELNTLLNGSKEGQERKMVLAMKNIFQSGIQGNRKYCDECATTFETVDHVESHMTEHEGPGVTFQSIFLSNHEEVIDETKNHCNNISWEVLLSEEEAAELGNREKGNCKAA